jgi:hypothetical protein
MEYGVWIVDRLNRQTATVLLCYCATVLLCFVMLTTCCTVLLYRCTAVPLYHCMHLIPRNMYVIEQNISGYKL